MSSTFTGPVRVFKRNNPSNNGVIAPSNAGAAECTVQNAIVGGTATTVVIPAGSIITNIRDYITTAAGTPAATNVTVAGTAVGTLTDAAGVNSITFASGATAVGLLANVGTSDVTISYTAGASAAGTFSVTYTPRNTDGTITPIGSGFTNS
jgi:hypothetical protein